MLEVLTTYWGFYFVATTDAKGVGIRDLQDVLEDLTNDPAFVDDLQKDPNSQNRVKQSRNDFWIAYLPLKRVLAARIAAFKASALWLATHFLLILARQPHLSVMLLLHTETIHWPPSM